MGRETLIVQELLRRATYVERGYMDTKLKEEKGSADFLFSHLFDKQRAFVTDTAPQVSACCSRRAGKSFAIGTLMMRTARARQDALIVYMCPTRMMAKRIMWKKILKPLNRDYGLGASFNETDLIAKLPNGSEIMLLGADKESDIGKIRGVALDLAVLDEAQNFRPHIETFIQEDLGPTLADYDGQLYVTGTPRRMRSGFFHQITAGKAKGWSVHHWTLMDNAAYPQWAGKPDWRELAQAWLSKYLEEHGLEPTMANVRREWYGEWVEDNSTLVYPYKEEVNAVEELPGKGPWTYGLGLDLGIMALTVAAWSPHDPNIYFVHSEKKHLKHGAIDWMGQRAVELRDSFKIRKIVADMGALGTHILDDLRTRYGLSVEKADKTQKTAYQTMFASEMVRGIVKVIPRHCKPLIHEWRNLQQEDDGTEDTHGVKDCADAALYIWRNSRHFRAKPRSQGVLDYEAMTPWEKEELKLQQRIERAHKKVVKDLNKPKTPRGVASSRLQGIL